jgi:hypothetical protein
LILDIILMLPERTEVNESVPSDKEVLEALKAELGILPETPPTHRVLESEANQSNFTITG